MSFLSRLKKVHKCPSFSVICLLFFAPPHCQLITCPQASSSHIYVPFRRACFSNATNGHGLHIRIRMQSRRCQRLVGHRCGRRLSTRLPIGGALFNQRLLLLRFESWSVFGRIAKRGAPIVALPVARSTIRADSVATIKPMCRCQPHRGRPTGLQCECGVICWCEGVGLNDSHDWPV